MAAGVRILILGDGTINLSVLGNELRRGGFEPTWERVVEETDFFKQLEPPPDLILGCYPPAPLDPFWALQWLREQALDVPFFIIATEAAVDWTGAARQAGAAGYWWIDQPHQVGSTVLAFLSQRPGGGLPNLDISLLNNQQPFAPLLETMADPVLIVQQDGRILFVNTQLETTFGHARQELVGRHFQVLIPERFHAVHREHFAKFLAHPQKRPMGRSGLFTGRRKDGQEFPVQLSLSPLRTAEGLIISAVVRDMTLFLQKEQRLRVQYDTARTLAEAPTEAEAMTRLMQTVCETLQWERGEVWRVDPGAQVLRLMGSWHRPGVALPAYEQASQALTFAPGEGLPGRVWATGQPLWVTNVLQNGSFRRKQHAALAGLHAAFGFPILWGGQVLGVIVYFSFAIRHADADLLHMFAALGSQIGQFMERKRHEEASAKSLALGRAVEQSPCLVIITDQVGRIQFVNRQFCEVTGYTFEEVLGQNPRFLKSGLQPSTIYKDLWDRLTAGQVWQGEFCNKKKNGELFWVNGSIGPVRDREGRVSHLVAVQEDITQRKQVEETLRRQAQILAQVHDIIIATDMDGCITLWNRGAEKNLGYAAAEVLGKFCGLIFPDEDQELLRTKIIAPLKDAGAVVREVRVKTKQGDYRRHYVSACLLRDVTGVPTGMMGYGIDVTERRRMEEQLRSTQKLEEIGRLAGGVAHDFNNLLTVINLTCECLLARLGPQDCCWEGVSEIHKAGRRAAALTRQLLAFSRQQVLAPVVLDLKAIMADLEKMLRRLIREDIELVFHPQPTASCVKADPGQLEQVIVNLVVNARDAMPQGGRLTLEIRNVFLDEGFARAYPDVTPGAYVLLSVSDTGCGMDEATLARIFEPFFTTKEVGKGTGLGLATVYGIVKQSGGFILVSSEVGKGSVFRLYLPHVAEAAPTGQSFQGLTQAPRGQETVLLVEDDDTVRLLTRTVLETNGYTVLEADHGLKALEILQGYRGPLHLLITDMVMPRMNGLELATHLRALFQDIKVLFLSGYTADVLESSGQVLPSDAFLQKPYTLAAFSTKVRAVLDGSPQNIWAI